MRSEFGDDCYGEQYARLCLRMGELFEITDPGKILRLEYQVRCLELQLHTEKQTKVIDASKVTKYVRVDGSIYGVRKINQLLNQVRSLTCELREAKGALVSPPTTKEK